MRATSFLVLLAALAALACAAPALAQTKNVPTSGTYYTGPATPIICVDPVTGATSACASATAGNVTVTGPIGAGSAATGVRTTLNTTDAAALQSIAANTAAATPPGTNSIGGVTTQPGATTPAAGTAHAIVTGGVAVTLVTGPVKGCYIQNPLTAADEGIATAEPLYVNAVTTATTLSTDGSSTALQPGQSFNCIPGQTTNISANAATSSHAAVVVAW